MKIILANPRGFCAGVYMAIDVVDQLLDICPDETIYVYHEIVHNRHVVDRFRGRGVKFIEELYEVPNGSIVVFSAHGVSPALRAEAKERNLTAVDATCPLVTKVHNEAIRYAKAGYQILLVGHADHQEIIGTRGEAPQKETKMPEETKPPAPPENESAPQGAGRAAVLADGTIVTAYTNDDGDAALLIRTP